MYHVARKVAGVASRVATQYSVRTYILPYVLCLRYGFDLKSQAGPTSDFDTSVALIVQMIAIAVLHFQHFPRVFILIMHLLVTAGGCSAQAPWARSCAG